ncbi:ParM/StbA family protein [Metabacillus arenae]|uniref:ParM/StbA family protein n=1 Tax=Metabacillus arenae TaxID=2771434 RepID=A0A926NJV6_9BACI|nr:ParM/StbA family protein [Metabacillus arenae]MBD1379191.1 ParM/StbA family protein [Metabacillus arenae]
MILGVDAGNSEVKIAAKYGLIKFLSDIGEGRNINLEQVHGEDDMVFEYEGKYGFAGSLAKYESEFVGSLMGDSKVHEDTKLRVLLGIHRYLTLNNVEEYNFQIIVGQPISKHTPLEKEGLRKLLQGKHVITVNEIKKKINIDKISVAAEAASSFWSNPQNGLTRIIDVGSGTVNYASVLEGRFIDKESGTLNFGMNTNKSNNLQALVRGIAAETLKKWNKEDNVFLVGGVAEAIKSPLKQYYPNVQVLQPIFNRKIQDPIFANAISFYNIGVSVYE